MTQVMDKLRQDHRNMIKLLDFLEGQARTLREEGEPNLELVKDVIGYCLTYPDRYHHPREDQIYRRMVEKGVSPDQIGDMEAAHDDLAGLTRRVSSALEAGRQDTNPKILADLIQSFIDSYRLHIEAEEHVFFPLAEDLFQAADWVAVYAAMEEMKDPLFSGVPAEAYQSLSQRILDRGAASAR